MYNTDRIAQLTTALRSGQYDQTRSYLRDTTGYCCLGVACEITGLGHFHPTHNGYSTFDGMTTMPPQSVSAWFLDDDIDGSLDALPTAARCLAQVGGVNEWYLTGMNDSGATFAEIADHIDRCIARIEQFGGQPVPDHAPLEIYRLNGTLIPQKLETSHV
jgi:hypothetical protein